MKRYVWLSLLFISLLPIFAFLLPGLPVTHDGQDHVARIANFYQSLSEGNIIPRWAGNLNWGYGHPILMFLYPLPSYITSLFHVIGFSFVDSTKLAFMSSFVISVLAMYLWVSSAWGKRAGVIAGVLYGFAPYRFVDMYVRGSIGEHVAFVFPPLIMYFLYRLSKVKVNNKKPFQFSKYYWYNMGIGVSIACLILSHNAVSLMFFPIILLYLIYLAVFETNNKSFFVLLSLFSIILGFLLSAFFWIPALFEGKYTLRDIVTKGESITRFVPWSWFFYSPWNYGQGNDLTKQLGFTQWIGVITGLYIVYKKSFIKQRLFVIGSLVLLGFSLFIMIRESAFVWNTLTVLQKFQFPWRFLTISVFMSAVISGISIDSITKRYKECYVYIIIILLLTASTFYMWKPKAFSEKPESFYSGIYESTTDTGESSPIWSVRFMEHRPDAKLGIIEGSVRITEGKRTSTIHEYSVESVGDARLVENTLYFPGWKVYVDGIQTGIQFQDPAYRGLMTFRVQEGAHTIRVIFTDTKLRFIANTISLMSIGIVLLSYGFFVSARKTSKRYV